VKFAKWSLPISGPSSPELLLSFKGNFSGLKLVIANIVSIIVNLSGVGWRFRSGKEGNKKD